MEEEVDDEESYCSRTLVDSTGEVMDVALKVKCRLSVSVSTTSSTISVSSGTTIPVSMSCDVDVVVDDEGFDDGVIFDNSETALTCGIRRCGAGHKSQSYCLEAVRNYDANAEFEGACEDKGAGWGTEGIVGIREDIWGVTCSCNYLSPSSTNPTATYLYTVSTFQPLTIVVTDAGGFKGWAWVAIGTGAAVVIVAAGWLGWMKWKTKRMVDGWGKDDGDEDCEDDGTVGILEDEDEVDGED